jgi:aspartate aminotransferase
MWISDKASELGTELSIQSFVRALRLKESGASVINLTLGSPDFQPPAHVVEAGAKALMDGHHGYTEPKGIRPLREAVAESIYSRYKSVVDPDHVLIVPGSKPLIFYALQMLVEPGDEVLVPNPGYPIYGSMSRFCGAKVVHYEFAAHAEALQSIAELREKINEKTRVIIINSPANPTGRVVSRDFMTALVNEVLKWPRLFILSDEVYDQISFAGTQIVSGIEFEDARERMIVVNGWSKAYAMTGWRLGYGLWPRALIETAERFQINLVSCANHAAQIAGIAALRGSQACIATMTRQFQARRDVLSRRLNDIPGLRCCLPGGAFYLFVDVRGLELSSQAVEDRLLSESGVAVVSGASFGPRGEGYIRMSLTQNIEQLCSAADRIESFVRSRA